ncbi:MAG: excinuclease ABC subunit C, partial [Erysipelotrichaceae bacterium]|nr:excinuclease ABC subunit C [Erysipelotrichaceae bacterium]
ASNEKDALILEQGMIKEYRPKYNILYMDDKTYPYICITRDPYFRVLIKRFKNKFDSRYDIYGPYPSATDANRIVELINQICPLRKCNKLKKKVCLYYHLGQCLGYCEKNIDDTILSDLKKKIIRILHGDVKDLIDEYQGKLDQAIEDLDFEVASEYASIIESLKYIKLDAYSEIKRDEDFDVVNFYAANGLMSICFLNIRGGRILNKQVYVNSVVNGLEEEYLSYIYQYYQSNPYVKDLYVNDASIREKLAMILDCNVIHVTKGAKARLIDNAYDNAKEQMEFKQKLLKENELYEDKVNEQLESIFNEPIDSIVMFDISHFGGKDTVAGKIQFNCLKPNKNQYRYYKLDEGADDLKSMSEAVYRYLFSLLKDNKKMPDLLLIDGALNQLRAVKDVARMLNLDIRMIALAKDDTHSTSYLIAKDESIIDIDPKSELFHFFTIMQEEVHRFAIGYNKRLRNKKYTHSSLTKIKGVGPNTAIKLLDSFGKVSVIREASVEELAKVVSLSLAKNIYNYYREDKNGDTE